MRNESIDLSQQPSGDFATWKSENHPLQTPKTVHILDTLTFYRWSVYM
jgi:hypothetical protein